MADFKPTGPIDPYAPPKDEREIWVTDVSDAFIELSTIEAVGWDNITADTMLTEAQAELLVADLQAALVMMRSDT